MNQVSVNMEICDGMNAEARTVKRWCDVVCALLGMLVLSPVFLLVYILLKCEGTNSVIFRQERIGLTRVGKFLREHHLDELPQLWNVLVGEMSFVGPRPERRYFIDLIRKENPDYDYLFLMRPGLTSKATLYNGYTDTMQKMLIRLQMDLEYLQQRSLWLDVKIIFTTISFILKGKKF